MPLAGAAPAGWPSQGTPSMGTGSRLLPETPEGREAQRSFRNSLEHSPRQTDVCTVWKLSLAFCWILALAAQVHGSFSMLALRLIPVIGIMPENCRVAWTGRPSKGTSGPGVTPAVTGMRFCSCACVGMGICDFHNFVAGQVQHQVFSIRHVSFSISLGQLRDSITLK